MIPVSLACPRSAADRPGTDTHVNAQQMVARLRNLPFAASLRPFATYLPSAWSRDLLGSRRLTASTAVRATRSAAVART